MREITRVLQRTIWESKIKTVEPREDGYQRWDIVRNLRYPADYAVWKFFPDEHAKSVVSPLERLIACWSHVAFAEEESPVVLNDDMKRDKKDIEVVQRLRMLQAMFISSSQGNYFMQTGDETTKRVNEEIASRGRSADKMDAYLQRREKERK